MFRTVSSPDKDQFGRCRQKDEMLDIYKRTLDLY